MFYLYVYDNLDLYENVFIKHIWENNFKSDHRYKKLK